ncbi:hypothetical protein A2Z67_02130 [Candidatus Woesebacteria bacterium RBG_13_36_22]|uniref:Uncharacterized protein n=1 Tax=Candidatus Woesebacteria bacterium RBG_13_36_22 TaxID=1802478 RepID=A0A1F7X0A0_9BACT|nr:MAG: hypothetical protein A2Z67_02130 [Candidatus Woesebacteria bacterium RBG_13_36_22]
MCANPEAEGNKGMPRCTFSWTFGHRSCTYPDSPCLIKELESQGILHYWHHGIFVEGDCTIEAQKEGYIPWNEQEHRGDPR